MCSSLLGLGGTHVQQCSECRISRICVPFSRSFKRNSIAASYQHHAGLQPANLVTYIYNYVFSRLPFYSEVIRFRNNFRENKQLLLCLVGLGSTLETFHCVTIHSRIHRFDCCSSLSYSDLESLFVTASFYYRYGMLLQAGQY